MMNGCYIHYWNLTAFGQLGKEVHASFTSTRGLQQYTYRVIIHLPASMHKLMWQCSIMLINKMHGAYIERSVVMSVSPNIIKGSNQGNSISWILLIRRYQCFFSLCVHKSVFVCCAQEQRFLTTIRQNLAIKFCWLLWTSASSLSLKERELLQGLPDRGAWTLADSRHLEEIRDDHQLARLHKKP